MDSPIPTVIVTPSTPCFTFDAHCPSSPSPSPSSSSSSGPSSTGRPRARIRTIRRHTHPLFPLDDTAEEGDDLQGGGEDIDTMHPADLLTPLRYAGPHPHGHGRGHGHGHGAGGRKRRAGGTIPFIVFVLAVFSLVLASALIPRHLENELHLSTFTRSGAMPRRIRTGPPTSRIEWGPGHTLRSIESLAKRNGRTTRTTTTDDSADVDKPSSKLGNRGPVSAETWRAYRERRAASAEAAAGAGAGAGAVAPDAGMAGMELWDFH